MKKLILGLTAASCLASSALAYEDSHSNAIRLDLQSGYGSEKVGDNDEWQAPLFLGVAHSNYLFDYLRYDSSANVFVYAVDQGDEVKRNHDDAAWNFNISQSLLVEYNVFGNLNAFGGVKGNAYTIFEPKSKLLHKYTEKAGETKESEDSKVEGLGVTFVGVGFEGGANYNFDNNLGLEGAISYTWYKNDKIRDRAVPHNFGFRLGLRYSW